MEELTLMQNVCKVVRLVRSSNFSDEFWKESADSLKVICEKMELSPIQAVLLSVIMECSCGRSISTSKLADFINCNNVELIQYDPDIEILVKRQFIHYYRGFCDENAASYSIQPEVIKSIQNGQAYKPEPINGLTIDKLFLHIKKIMTQTANNEFDDADTYAKLYDLIKLNQHLKFCQEFNPILDYFMGPEAIILAQCCNLHINSNYDTISWGDIKKVMHEDWVISSIHDLLVSHSGSLFNSGILEPATSNSIFGDRETYAMTAKAKSTFFSEIPFKSIQVQKNSELILASKLQSKQMYFNRQEQCNIDRLGSLLLPEQFNNITQRLQQKGMRQGFACLFYGSPGTGKTESVYQLARQSGRDIMQVNISETKSMWFGESEKLIKGTFDRYRTYVKTSPIAPILLFNEADAILGCRHNTNEGATRQTENAIQNIILQEIEQLEGILIATTNLTQNLDKAFERRFLYKIEFHRPLPESRSRIWQSMIPSIQSNAAQELAERFDLSGGQIENIVRKYTVDCIMMPQDESTAEINMIDILSEYCRDELSYNSSDRKRIGY